MPCSRLFAERYAINAAAEPVAIISAKGDAPTGGEDLSVLAVFISSEPPAIVTA